MGVHAIVYPAAGSKIEERINAIRVGIKGRRIRVTSRVEHVGEGSVYNSSPGGQAGKGGAVAPVVALGFEEEVIQKVVGYPGVVWFRLGSSQGRVGSRLRNCTLDQGIPGILDHLGLGFAAVLFGRVV